jgi:hypothetical protein
LEHKRDIENRVSTHITVWTDSVNDGRKWIVLVYERFVNGRSKALKDVVERRLSGKIASQHNHVCKQANRVRKLVPWPRRRRRTDRESILICVAIQQNREDAE